MLLGFEVGIIRCSTLMTFYLEVVSTRSTYWTNVESDDEYSLHQTYEYLNLKRTMVMIDHSLKENNKDHLDQFVESILKCHS